ncbi:hypothetical protein [Amnibacterium endophyticum]|uniref:Uncharacterized protein n=1 Tax=Amnibacterium endophyticum TaxID=2109337 RepID=A0ABW4LHU6_9MICO
MSAADTLEFRIESHGDGPARLRRAVAAIAMAVNSSTPPGGVPPLDDALVVRRASGAVVLRGPVKPGLRRFLKRAVERDLGSMSESEFLRAWGPPGGWDERYKRWQERGWVPPVL